MSTGIVICSACKREVHQDGPHGTWLHCEDKTLICQGSHAAYPKSKTEIVGNYCGRDE